MSDVFTTEVFGLSELEQRLRDLPKKLAIKVVRSAGREGGKIFQDEIERNAPRKTGFLAEHIDVATKAVGGDEGHLQVKVGPDRQAFYGSFDEFGTMRQAAHPFVRPAFESKKEEVLQVFVDTLRNNLDDLKE